MTRNVVVWGGDIGMPRRNWATLWRAVFGPGRSGSSTARMRVADLDQRMLRDIGFERRARSSGQRSAGRSRPAPGWACRPASAAERREKRGAAEGTVVRRSVTVWRQR